VYRDNERSVGDLVYVLLSLFFASCRRSISVSEVMQAVWGATVSENTLWGLLRRSRFALKDLGHPWLVYLEGDQVCIG
jgi:hypothetical protein